MEDRVARDVVFRALAAAGPPHSPYKLYISVDNPKEDYWVTISDGTRPGHVTYIPNSGLTRQSVNRLVKRYGVPKDWFYTPLLIPGDEEKKSPC